MEEETEIAKEASFPRGLRRARVRVLRTFAPDHPRTFHSALTLPVFRVEMQSNGDLSIGDPIGIELARMCECE